MIFVLLVVFLSLSGICEAQIYVNGTLGNDAYNGLAPLPGPPPLGPKKTINAGIGVASAGQTVYVAAGTYSEQVLVNKAIVLQGAGAITTTIAAPGNLLSGADDAIVTVDTGTTASITGFTIDGGIFSVRNGITYKTNAAGVISSNIVKNISAPSAQGTAIRLNHAAPDVTSNTLQTYGLSGIYICGTEVSSTCIVSTNTITGQGSSISPDRAQYGIEVDGGAAPTIGGGNEISDNRSGSMAGLSSAGIFIHAQSNPRIARNNIHNNDFGIIIGYLVTDTSAPAIMGNTFTDNDKTAHISLVGGSATIGGPASTDTNTFTFVSPGSKARYTILIQDNLSQPLTIQNNSINNGGCVNTGIRLGYVAQTVSIIGNDISNCVYRAIEMQGTSGILYSINSNNVFNSPYGINVFSGDGACQISGNTIDCNNLASSLGIEVSSSCDGVRVLNNNVRNCEYGGIEVRGDNILLDTNTLVNADTIGIRIVGSADGAVLNNNNVSGSSHTGIELRGTNTVLTINTVHSNGDIGIESWSGNSKLQGNSITNNPIGVSIMGGQPDLGGGAFASTGGNTISGSPTMNLWNYTSADIMAENNSWGSSDFDTIEATIRHKPDAVSLGFVDFVPFVGYSPPTYVWVNPAYTNATYRWGYDRFGSVGGGAAGVADGGTVEIASATYTENASISKKVWLKGTSKTGVVVQSTSNGTINITAADCRITSMTITHTAGGMGINISGASGTIIDNCIFSGPRVAVNLDASGGSDNTTVQNCTFPGCQAILSGGNNTLNFLTNVCDNSTSHDLVFAGGSGLTVRGCTLTGAALSSILIRESSSILIENNTIDGACRNISPPSGIGVEFGAITSIGDSIPPYTPDTGLTIRNNTIRNTLANATKYNAYSSSCTIRTGAIGFEFIPNNCLIENNTIENNADGGLQINRRIAGIMGFVCRNNDFINNGGYGFEVNPTYNNDPQVNNYVIANLSANWWGATSGPKNAINNPTGIGAEIKRGQAGDELDFSPWLGAQTGSAPQSWYVLKLSDVPDAQTTIGEGVNSAASGDSVFVGPGTYVEGVDITQSLYLRSTRGASLTIIDGTACGRPFTSGVDIPIAIKPSSDDYVMVDEFNIINSFIGVEMKDTGGHSSDHISLTYCRFDNVNINGIAVVVEHSTADIENNTINGNGAGIRIANSSNCTLQGNNITNGNNYGISVSDDNTEGLGALTCENISIISNTISNLVSSPLVPAYGIFVGRTDTFNPGTAPFGKNNTISDNVVTTCGHTGIIFDCQNDPTDGVLVVSGNTVEGCGTFAGVTADGIWSIGSLSNNYGVTFSQNTIRYNSDVGLTVDNGNIKAQENIITNNGTGVIVNGGIVDLGNGPYASAGLNHIENNSVLNLWNTAPADMKAELNWWGSIDYNTVEATIDHKPDNAAEGLVDFIPFKGITDPDPVWVSRAYSKLTLGWGYDHFDNLHDGTQAVATFGNVNVADGTYDAEDSYPVVIPKCETIYGASRSGTIIRNPASIVDTGAQTGTILLDIYGDNVTIANFTIDGDYNPLLADDASIPELGHGDAVTTNDVNALIGVRLNPPGASTTADNLRLTNINFKNLYIGASVSGRPAESGELSSGNVIEGCEFTNIGAGAASRKDGAGVYFTSAQVEVTSGTFTNCDCGIRGEISAGSSVVSEISAHDNAFIDNYFGIFLDGTKGSDPNSGITTFDPDAGGSITEGIAHNTFSASTNFRNDTDHWNPASGDFIEHFNLDGPTSNTFTDPTPPTTAPDTPVGFFAIATTDPLLATCNTFNGLRRAALIMSQRGLDADNGTVTLLDNHSYGPGTDAGFDAVGILARNRLTYGDTDANDDFGGDVKVNMYHNYIEGAVDLIRLQEEPVVSLAPTMFYITIGGAPAYVNTFGLTRTQAINLGFFNITGGGMKDDVDATYNDFLVNTHQEVEDVVYHKVDDSTLGLVTFLPARRLAYGVSLVANPQTVTQYNVTVNLTATVTDGFGDPAADGIPVVFTTDLGDLGTSGSILTAGGTALNTLEGNVDGTAHVTATADGVVFDSTDVVFNVTGMEYIIFYPFDNPDMEGWEAPLTPGTYVEAKDGSFYIAPTTQPTGQIGILSNYTVNMFAYWTTKGGYEIEYLPNKVYRARYRMRTDQPDKFKVPMARLRWGNMHNMGYARLAVSAGPSAPSNYEWTDYYSYYYPPDFSGATDKDLTLSFDLVDFTLEQSGGLYLDEVEVWRFNPPPADAGTFVMSYESQADFTTWTGLNIPDMYGPVAYGSNSTGLYLESGIDPSPPPGKSGLPDYGSWELPAGLSPAAFLPQKLYRATFTLQVPNASTRQTVAKIRMRIQNGAPNWLAMYQLYQTAPGDYHSHMPSVTGTEYSVFIESPKVLYTGSEAVKNNIALAFDLVDGTSYEYGRVYLTKVEVEYYDVP